jgi:ribonuclease G
VAGRRRARATAPRREVLVAVDGETARVAVFEDGRLVAVDLGPTGDGATVGSVYKGRVADVLPGMQVAFVDVGVGRNAFLCAEDAQPEEDGRPARAIEELLRPGQEVLVQVRKEATGRKGARVSRRIALPGRFLVLLPGAGSVGVSRRVADPAERARLAGLAAALREPGFGLVVRTAAEGQGEDALAADYRRLRALWEGLRARAEDAAAPACVYRELEGVARALREHLGPGLERVVVDEPSAWEEVRARLSEVDPELGQRVELAPPEVRRVGLFAAWGVPEELARALGRRVPLPSGGYLVIEETEALTAVDVNTGRFVGSEDPEETFLATNREAAWELARQLRLRDVGGLVVVDFVRMERPEHWQELLATLEEATAADPAQPVVEGVTRLGLVELSRRKTRQSLQAAWTRGCPGCGGTGRVPTVAWVALWARDRVRRLVAGRSAEAVLVEAHPEVAAHLVGAGGAGLRALERATGRAVFVRGAPDLAPEALRLRAEGPRAEVEALASPVRPGQRLEVLIEAPHASARDDGIARVDGFVVDVAGAARHVGRRVQVEVTELHRTFARARLV